MTFTKLSPQEADAKQPYYRAFLYAHDLLKPVDSQHPFIFWIDTMWELFYREIGPLHGYCQAKEGSQRLDKQLFTIEFGGKPFYDRLMLEATNQHGYRSPDMPPHSMDC